MYLKVFILTLLLLSWAIHDSRFRKVPNSWVSIMVIFGVGFLISDLITTGQPKQHAISFLVSVVATYILTDFLYSGGILGGADAKGLIAISTILYFPPWLTAGISVIALIFSVIALYIRRMLNKSDSVPFFVCVFLAYALVQVTIYTMKQY